jgi:hypothetical protein
MRFSGRKCEVFGECYEVFGANYEVFGEPETSPVDNGGA